MTSSHKAVLIIEDDPDLVGLLEYNLKKEGFEVLKASSGVQGLWEIVGKSRPHCILLDLMMPSPDGFELCDFLKLSEDYRDIPLIVLSARGESETIERVMNLGADAFMPKPFSMDSLIGLVQRYCSRGPGIRPTYQVRSPERI